MIKSQKSLKSSFVHSVVDKQMLFTRKQLGISIMYKVDNIIIN